LPAEFENPADYEKINPDDELVVENLNAAIKSADVITINDKTESLIFKCRLNLSARDRQILLAGGLLQFTKSK
jgi:aconitate hydratase